MIASTMVRASANGLPARPVRVGSIGAINSHWVSESIWNRDMSPGSQLTRASILRHALGELLELARVLGVPFATLVAGIDAADEQLAEA